MGLRDPRRSIATALPGIATHFMAGGPACGQVCYRQAQVTCEVEVVNCRRCLRTKVWRRAWQAEIDRRYPEHKKLQAVTNQSQVCGEFLEWIRERYTLCQLDEYDRFFPVNPPIRDLLAEFFEIDRAKIEQEKRAMLDVMRGAQ